MPHVFVADIDAPELDPDDRHHLERVLRTRDGEEVTVADGDGGWRRCVFRTGGRLEPVAEPETIEAPTPAITVAFALTKGDKPELTVQKLTEVGVDRIVPFTAARSVTRWDGEKAARQVERLRKVAREAAMQSRRARLPVVDDLRDFTSVAALPGAVRAEQGGAPPTLDRPTVLVGPEGGWSDAERAVALPVVGLGPQVLRAETAAMAAAVVFVSLRLGLVEHARSLPHEP